MKLPVRPSPYILPSYSLTGDVLNFMRCGLQYRYYNVGKLPSTNPVQLWFGQFIHGVMEEAYRKYDENIKQDGEVIELWEDKKIIEDIIKLVEDRLTFQGLFPWNENVEEIGKERAKTAIKELGPNLFPLIQNAEVRLTGARDLELDPNYQHREADKYEITGVVDVITDVELSDLENEENSIVNLINDVLDDEIEEGFEVIVDYKGMRRPPKHKRDVTDFWKLYEWQVQTYAHLRRNQTDKPIKAGVLVYINELLPSKTDLQKLKKEIKEGLTDIIPEEDSKEYQLIKKWNRNKEIPLLPYDFRLKRAIRVIPINEETISESLAEFDKIVKKIEKCLAKEKSLGNIIDSWEKDGSDESTCTACDAKTFCPDSSVKGLPKLPGLKER